MRAEGYGALWSDAGAFRGVGVRISGSGLSGFRVEGFRGLGVYGFRALGVEGLVHWRWDSLWDLKLH